MTTALSGAAETRRRFSPPSTSGLADDALLVKRLLQTNGWSERIDELLDIRRMENDWDGLGAPAPSTALVDSALLLAQHLRQEKVAQPCRIVAGLTGSVLFEWQAENGSYFELEVTHPGHADWVRMAPNQATAQGGLEW